MASTILYKFRSEPNFVPLPLPGTSARLFDAKRAVVRARKLDRAAIANTSLEFDLVVQNAMTNEVYDDERLILPRGARVVVLRVAAERGRGILSRLAMGGGAAVATSSQAGASAADAAARDGFYTVRYRDREVDDKLLDADPPPPSDQADESKEHKGIPRTFLTLGGGEQLAPSSQQFQDLVHKAGGQPFSDVSKRCDLDYALRLTATSIPEHLQCGICHSIVKNAMLVPWDTEGRPACEPCIRDGLMSNGFTCPLTGTEGASPDDLFPNVGLRKAADAFVQRVMEKMDAVERQIEQQEKEERKKCERDDLKANKRSANALNDVSKFGDGVQEIVMKNSKLNAKKEGGGSNDNFLLFGGDDEFGGDVFDVANDESDGENDDEEEARLEDAIIEPKAKKDLADNTKKDNGDREGAAKDAASLMATGRDDSSNSETTSTERNINGNNNTINSGGGSGGGGGDSASKVSDRDKASQAASRKEAMKCRGPPAGYVLGPAGNGVGGTPPSGEGGPSPFGGCAGGGRFYGGRGGGGGRGFNQPYGSGRVGAPPMQHHPQQGGYNQGGRGGGGGFHRNQQWGINNGGGYPNWNKRPRDMMEQGGGPAYQKHRQNQGGGGGPPGGYVYQGRGGGGRFQGGRNIRGRGGRRRGRF